MTVAPESVASGNDVARPFSVSAVLAGLLVDFGATALTGVGLVITVAYQLRAEGVAMTEICLAILEKLETPAWYWSGVILGLACTTLGGHVTGRMASHAPIRHAAALGILVLASWSLTDLRVEDAVGAALSLPAALAGAALVRPAA